MQKRGQSIGRDEDGDSGAVAKRRCQPAVVPFSDVVDAGGLFQEEDSRGHCGAMPVRIHTTVTAVAADRRARVAM